MFFLSFSSISRQLTFSKWIPHGRMVEGSSKRSEFFTGVLCTLLSFLMINEEVLEYTKVYKELVLLR